MSGVHRDGPKGGSQHLVYNIVLEPLVLGVPREAVMVGVFAVLCIGLAVSLEPLLTNTVWGKRRSNPD